MGELKFVIAPDSFKESLSALQAARTIEEAIREVVPAARIEVVPMADGGEGTVEALTAAAQGVIRREEITGPSGQPVMAEYGILDSGKDGGLKGKTAVLEAASTFGLAEVPKAERDPYWTTTRGMGELMLRLLDQGIREFIIGLGGSATNDGGMGMLSALGVRFYDRENKLLDGYGRDLADVARVSVEDLDPRLAECRILIASDVQNPLCGPQGASVVYGPQKGATPDQVAVLDEALESYAERLSTALGRSAKNSPGAGAAGGAGYALLSLGAELKSGAEVIASASRLKEKLEGADWVITGEGKSDYQTLYGKLPVYVARLAKEAGVPTILLSGSLGEKAEELEREFAACFSCVHRPMTLAECLEEAEGSLRSAARNLVRLIQGVSRT